MAAVRLRDQALLLRRFPYGESSLVVHALTRDHGRVHLLAKGVYRPKTPFYAALDLFDTLELEWSARAGRDLDPLAGARILERRHLGRDLPRYEAAVCVLELLGMAARPGAPAPRLFDLGVRALDELDEGREPPARALVSFELGFLAALGLAPALTTCAACGGDAPALEPDAPSPRAAFSAGAGGRLCRSCAEEARAAGRRVGTLPVAVLGAAADLARDALRERAADDRGPALDPAGLDNVRDVVARFLEYHLEARPKSYRAFLASPQRNAPRRGATAAR